MKLPDFLTSTLFSVIGTAQPPASQDDKLVPVHLPSPDNWVAVEDLYISRRICGYFAHLNKCVAKSWAAHINKECRFIDICTPTISYSELADFSIRQRVGRGPVVWIYLPGRSCDPVSAVNDSTAFTIREREEIYSDKLMKLQEEL
ncbi:hypothetical protein BBP40_009775 [Aspergillus hancockii]|nr:hypothetical protein BBP40_009775 [Aspergillus hancockii]